MKISLQYKLFGAILAAILVVVLYMSLVMQWSFDRGFMNYVNTVELEQLQKIADDLETGYAEHGNWNWLKDDPGSVAQYLLKSYPEGKLKQRILEKLKRKGIPDFLLSHGPVPEDIPIHFFRRAFLLDWDKRTVFGFDYGGPSAELVELYYQNKVVGYVGVHPARHLVDSHHLVFAQQQKVTLGLVALAGVLIAAAISLPITWMVTRPLRKMAAAARSLASGGYETRLTVSSVDEYGQLAQDLNDLAQVLEENQKARSRWIADISHELRTPLSILRGKVEALQDGVYQPGPEVYQSLHREVASLSLLVEDLYQLSLSDLGAMSYNRVEVEPSWALNQAIESVRREADEKDIGIQVSVKYEDGDSIFADNDRLKQLFTNLLTNSVRYTDQGGEIKISVRCIDANLIYTIDDSTPGVSDEDLTRLFERLFRVEGSRSRDLGGAGLGLSICHNIVAGHNGTIEAAHSVLGGLNVRITLPLFE